MSDTKSSSGAAPSASPGSTPAGSDPNDAAVADATAHRLSGNLGTVSLVLSVLAFSAPIVTVAGYTSFVIGFVGQAAPLAWVLATITLAIFAVGYTTMTRHIPRPGAFYAYISLGVGRVAGVGAAFLATISYILININIYCFSGVTIAALIEGFGGPETPWWIWTAIGWVVVTSLAHFHIELSAKVLGAVMVLEVILVLIFNIFILGKGGASGLSAAPLNPSLFLGAGTGLALLFALGNFIGFEATTLYRDEVRNPNKTIPRATYVAVVAIGLFYALSAYSMVTAFGSNAVTEAKGTPGTMFSDALTTYVTPALNNVALVLVATSALASVLSTHNVAARYLHNLSADHALPSFLSAVHPKHTSPYKASFANAVIVGGILVVLALAGADPSLIIGGGSGIGTAGVLILMALVSLAVLLYFARTGRPAGESRWKVFVAPAVSVLILGGVVVTAVLHFELLVGGDPGQRLWMLLVLVVVLVAGCLVALYFRKNKPQWYAMLGRAEADLIAPGREGEDAQFTVPMGSA